MSKPSQIRKGDRVSIPATITGHVVNVTPALAGARVVTVDSPPNGFITLTVPEGHDITIHQITLGEDT